MEASRQREREHLDKLLGRFQRGRERQPQQREEFTRAATGDSAQGNRARPEKSEAIARAIEKVKKKQERQNQREQGGSGRGRSLTDTFNKARK